MAFPFTPLSNQWLNGEEETQVTMNARIDQNLNLLAANFGLVQAPTIFIGQQQTPQSLTSGSASALTIDTEVIDVYGGHTGTSTQYIVPAALNGMRLRYVVNILYTGNATGARIAHVNQNTVLVPGMNASWGVNSATGAGIIVTGSSLVATGDVIEMVGEQISGGALSTLAGSQLEIYWAGTT